MASRGPLDHPQLRAVDALLNHGALDEAKTLLADLGSVGYFEIGAAYLATKMLFLRGRLDIPSVSSRLRDLLHDAPEFPEARELLDRVERGELSQPPPDFSSMPPGAFLSAGGPSRPSAPPGASGPADTIKSPPPPSDVPPLLSSQSLGEPEPPSSRPDPAFPEVRPSHPPGQLRNVLKTIETPELNFASDGPMPSVPGLHDSPPSTPSGATSENDPRSSQRGGRRGDVGAQGSPGRVLPPIPRAPAVPYFSRPPDSRPSYAPEEVRPEASEAPGAGASPSSRPPLPASLGLGRPDRNAGRYSAPPPAAEQLTPSRPPVRSRGGYSSHPPPVAAAQPRRPITARDALQAEGKVRFRSGAPQDLGGARPTLFEIANLLDRGLYDEALRKLDEGTNLDVDLTLMRVRAMLGAGRRQAGMAALRQLQGRDDLDGEQRAGAARLQLELGDIDGALAAADEARRMMPDAAMVRITYAWAALRKARGTEVTDHPLVARARDALEGLSGRGSPRPSLVLALRACQQAHTGESERAIAIAQRALGLDRDSTDALAAIAIAAARLGRSDDAREACTRYAELVDDPGPLVATLRKLGVRIASPSATPGQPSSRPTREWWDPLEMRLADGERVTVLRAFEQACRQTLHDLAATTREDSFSMVADAAADFLTTAPIWRNFPPWDYSLWSLHRLDAVLGLLYHQAPEERLRADEYPARLLVGAYLGETLARVAQGRWDGAYHELEDTSVLIGSQPVYPFQLLKQRVEDGQSLAESALLPFGQPDTVPRPWGFREPRNLAPPTPWAPDPWPSLEALTSLGTALEHSTLSLFAMEQGGHPLDGTLQSLAALDRYLDLVSPAGAPPAPRARWAPRVAGVVGAYLSATLQRHVGARWASRTEIAVHPAEYRMSLPDGSEVRPLAVVFSRVVGENDASLWKLAERIRVRLRA